MKRRTSGCSRPTSGRRAPSAGLPVFGSCGSCPTSARRCGASCRASSRPWPSTTPNTPPVTSLAWRRAPPIPATRPGSRTPVPADLPAHARCVIIGGGLCGASIPYHLVSLGWTDVVLLERADLTSGSTFHSAGFVGQLRASVSLTRMMMYGVELYRRLEREAAVPPGWRETGGLRLAASPERLEELRRQASWARTFGLPLELISPGAARDLFPLLDLTGVLGASFLPSDGYIDPSRLCRALAAGAERGGCRIVTGARVDRIRVDGGRVREVGTETGSIATDIVVNAGGIYAAEIGRLAGVRVPLVPLLHQYAVTEPFMAPHEKGESLPTLRDLDGLIYVRPEGKGLAMGGYHADSTPWSLGPGGIDKIPNSSPTVWSIPPGAG